MGISEHFYPEIRPHCNRIRLKPKKKFFFWSKPKNELKKVTDSWETFKKKKSCQNNKSSPRLLWDFFFLRNKNRKKEKNLIFEKGVRGENKNAPKSPHSSFFLFV